MCLRVEKQSNFLFRYMAGWGDNNARGSNRIPPTYIRLHVNICVIHSDHTNFTIAAYLHQSTNITHIA
jgi:hypothetical protein